jgi:4'-phosphopantetheinyl transferase
VHVWKADLEKVSDELSEYLSEEEWLRARRITGERTRMRWRRSRGLLRALLGAYLEQSPTELQLATGHRGKPALQAAGAQLSFNLSHSRRFALLAVRRNGEVGVDIEVVRELPANAVALAERAFGNLETRREHLDGSSCRREFMRAWTRREAELKCHGTGFGSPLETPVGEPWVQELEPGPGLAGAVACASPASELRCWEWPPEGS